MVECQFCSIVKAAERSTAVHEDDEVLAFMDRNPVNRGHVLVIPKNHVEQIQDLDERVYVAIMIVARKIALAFESLYSPTKVGFAVAGFHVAHAHLHVIPLYDFADLAANYKLDVSIKKSTLAALSEEATRIRSSMENDGKGHSA